MTIGHQELDIFVCIRGGGGFHVHVLTCARGKRCCKLLFIGDGFRCRFLYVEVVFVAKLNKSDR